MHSSLIQCLHVHSELLPRSQWFSSLTLWAVISHRADAVGQHGCRVPPRRMGSWTGSWTALRLGGTGPTASRDHLPLLVGTASLCFRLLFFPAWPVGTLGSPSSFLIKPHACVLRSFCSRPFPEAREARTTPAVGVQLAGRGGRQAAPRNVFCLIYSNNVSFSFWLSSKPLIRLLWPQTAKRRLRQMG